VTKRARWAAVLLAFAFGAWVPAQTVLAPGQNVVLIGGAIITEVSGTVQIRVGNEPPRTLQAGRRVPAGAVVTTSGDANAVLSFADGQIIVLGERTTFRIVSYQFDQKNMEQSGVSLNLIEGSARLVMGAIGQHDPRLIRIQVGTGTLVGATNPEGGNAADAGVVVQGASTMVTVTQGRVVLTLPTGQGVVVASGQGVYVQPNGNIQQGTITQIANQVGQTADGRQIVDQIDAMQSYAFPQQKQLTVITLATPESVRTSNQADTVAAAVDALPPPAETQQPVTTTPTTAATGGAGGGTPCGASCN
jgi:hypothetical protein